MRTTIVAIQCDYSASECKAQMSARVGERLVELEARARGEGWRLEKDIDRCRRHASAGVSPVPREVIQEASRVVPLNPRRPPGHH